MSKHWHYEVWIPSSPVLTRVELSGILQEVAAYGYSARQISRLVPSNDMEEYATTTLAAAVDILADGGGLVDVQKHIPVEWPLEFQLAIPAAAVVNPAVSPTSGDAAIARSYNEVTLYISDSFYRSRNAEEHQERLAMATDIQGLYCKLCTYLQAPYGSAWSNYDYEEIIIDLHKAVYGHYEPGTDKETFQPLMDGERLDKEVSSGRPPGALFWLQYFSHEYASHINLGECVELGGKIRDLPQGILLSFFDYPWEVDFAQLLTINKRWRDLNPESLSS